MARANYNRWVAANPERLRDIRRRSETKNRHTKRERERKRHYADPSKAAARVRKRYHKDLERSRAYNRDYYAEHRDKHIQKVVDRQKAFRTPDWADLDAIASIYREARRLSLETGIEHQVDHIVPLKGKEVCGLHVESNLQILTKAANMSKSNKLPTEDLLMIIPVLEAASVAANYS